MQQTKSNLVADYAFFSFLGERAALLVFLLLFKHHPHWLQPNQPFTWKILSLADLCCNVSNFFYLYYWFRYEYISYCSRRLLANDTMKGTEEEENAIREIKMKEEKVDFYFGVFFWIDRVLMFVIFGLFFSCVKFLDIKGAITAAAFLGSMLTCHVIYLACYLYLYINDDNCEKSDDGNDKSDHVGDEFVYLREKDEAHGDEGTDELAYVVLEEDEVVVKEDEADGDQLAYIIMEEDEADETVEGSDKSADSEEMKKLVWIGRWEEKILKMKEEYGVDRERREEKIQKMKEAYRVDRETWEEKIQKMKEEYRVDRERWEGKIQKMKVDRERWEEKIQKMKEEHRVDREKLEEKIQNLSAKLLAANATAEFYRNLLHDTGYFCSSDCT